MSKANELWNYPIEAIINGYFDCDGKCQCVICGETFQKGRIYPFDGNLYDAFGSVRYHIAREHGTMADYLLKQEPDLTGISEIQSRILGMMSDGNTDKDISAALGIAPSTVRNHRFKLREKEKHAKLFLALMDSLEKKTNNKIGFSQDGAIREIHASATMIDDRYNITEQEYLKTLRNYMDETGAIKQFPSKEKKKIILLTEIAKNFKRNESYTEKEVNRILKRIYEEDYPTIRRALIEYGFMDRSTDCRTYRIKE